MGPETLEKVLEKLAVMDKATIVVAKEPAAKCGSLQALGRA